MRVRVRVRVRVNRIWMMKINPFAAGLFALSKFSGKMRESGTSTPISGGKTDEWVKWTKWAFCTKIAQCDHT